MTDHLKGLLITTIGVLFVVPDSLFVRLIDAEPMVTAFWRALFSGVIVLAILLAWQGTRGFRAVLGTGWIGAIYVILIGSTAPAFVMAVTYTSVANVVFIFACMPIFASLFSRLLMAEPIRLRMVLTMLVVLFGLGIIAYGSGTSEVASWKGDLWAVYIAMAYALALTLVRHLRAIPMIPAIPVAFLGAALILGLVTEPLPALSDNWFLFLGHGAVIAVATCLLTIGPRYISSAEVALLVLLESVLAPLLVWLVVGEDPGPWAILGGAVVIGALIVSNLVALRAAGSRPA